MPPSSPLVPGQQSSAQDADGKTTITNSDGRTSNWHSNEPYTYEEDTLQQDAQLLRSQMLRVLSQCLSPDLVRRKAIHIYNVWCRRVFKKTNIANDKKYAKTPKEIMKRIVFLFENHQANPGQEHIRQVKHRIIRSLIEKRANFISLYMRNPEFMKGLEYIRQLYRLNPDFVHIIGAPVSNLPVIENDEKKGNNDRSNKKRSRRRKEEEEGDVETGNGNENGDVIINGYETGRGDVNETKNGTDDHNEHKKKRKKINNDFFVDNDLQLDTDKKIEFLQLDIPSQERLVKLEKLKMQHRQIEFDAKKIEASERKAEREFELTKLELQLEQKQQLKQQQNLEKFSRLISKLGDALLDTRKTKTEKELKEEDSFECPNRRRIKEEDGEDDDDDNGYQEDEEHNISRDFYYKNIENPHTMSNGNEDTDSEHSSDDCLAIADWKISSG